MSFSLGARPKLITYLILVVLASLLVAMPVLAVSTYTAIISVANTTATAYTMFPYVASMNVTELASNSYITASGLDTKVNTSTPFMLVSDKLLFAQASPAYSSGSVTFSTNNAAATAFNIVTGYDYFSAIRYNMGLAGYFYTGDAPALEPGSDFSIEYNGYIDTTAGYGTSMFYKREAIVGYSTVAGGNVAADVLAATAARDVGGISAATSNVTNTTWWSQTFTAASTYWVTSIDVDVTSAATTGLLVVGIRSSAANSPTGISWTMGQANASGLAGVTSITLAKLIRITTGMDYAVVLGTAGADAAVAWARSAAGVANATSTDTGVTWTAGAVAGQFVFQMYGTAVTTTVSTACATGTHTITIRGTGGGGNLGIKVDAAAEATVPIAAVPNTAYNYEWMRGCAYATSVKLTVAGTLIVHYQPIGIIGASNYTTGTATFTNGSTAVTGAGTTWTKDMLGRNIKGDVDAVWHTVLSVTDATHLTLASNYSAAGGAGLAYTISQGLPDREENKPGIVIYGSNPGTAAVGSLMPVSGSTTGTPISPPGAAGNINAPSNMFAQDADMEVPNSILTPFFRAFGSLSNTPVVFFWWMGYGICILIAIGVTYKYLQHLWMAGMVALIVTGAFVAMGAIPWWFLILNALFIGGTATMERSPSL